jgi:CubicO group peptidase (beta-lactamase class C family)
MARQTPAWEPGTRQGYHALTLGFYEGEIIRRVDPRGRSLGLFFDEEVAAPLGLDVYIRLPETMPNAKLATIDEMTWFDRLTGFVSGFPLRLALDTMNPRSNIYRALIVNPGAAICMDPARIYARNLEVPSGGGVGTARGIARAYGVFATGGRELGVRRETLDLLKAPAIPPAYGFADECMKGAFPKFSLGFMKPSESIPFGGPESFGHPGAGGAMAFADPKERIGYAYVTNHMGTSLSGDPRDVALRDALYGAARAM